MSEEIKVNDKKSDNALGIELFKNCSASLKKLSLVFFIINIFVTVIVTILAVVLIGVYVGTEMLSLLALPILTVIVIGVVGARLISALIYGFAEIVEKYENK